MGTGSPGIGEIGAALRRRLVQAGAFEVRVADPSTGFEHALEGLHPLALWGGCRAVAVFAVAHSMKTNNIFAGPFSPFEGDREIGPVPSSVRESDHALDRLSRLFISSIRLKGMALLSEMGYSASFRSPQLKLAAFEAGLGVYGRSGVLVHPVLGNRMSLGAIMTDAPLEPDGRLEGFDPCKGCAACAEACPANALDAGKEYPESWDAKRCIAKRAEIEESKLYCNNCFAACPACSVPEAMLLGIATADCISRRHRFELEIRDGADPGADAR
jgi:ferredoxin